MSDFITFTLITSSLTPTEGNITAGVIFVAVFKSSQLK